MRNNSNVLNKSYLFLGSTMPKFTLQDSRMAEISSMKSD